MRSFGLLHTQRSGRSPAPLRVMSAEQMVFSAGRSLAHGEGWQLEGAFARAEYTCQGGILGHDRGDDAQPATNADPGGTC